MNATLKNRVSTTRRNGCEQSSERISMRIYMDEFSRNHIQELRKSFSKDIEKNTKAIKKAYSL